MGGFVVRLPDGPGKAPGPGHSGPVPVPPAHGRGLYSGHRPHGGRRPEVVPAGSPFLPALRGFQDRPGLLPGRFPGPPPGPDTPALRPGALFHHFGAGDGPSGKTARLGNGGAPGPGDPPIDAVLGDAMEIFHDAPGGPGAYLHFSRGVGQLPHEAHYGLPEPLGGSAGGRVSS